MPISFRAARNLGLMLLLATILAISIFSYSMMYVTMGRLKTLIKVDELKHRRYAEIMQSISDAKEDFHSYLTGKEEGMISSIVLNLDEALKRLEIIKEKSPEISPDEIRIHKQVASGIQRFKIAVLSYVKIKDGYPEDEASGQQLRQRALVSSEDIMQLVQAANQYVDEEIADKHSQTLEITVLSQRILSIGLILGIIFTIFVGMLLVYAVSYPIHQLVNGTKEVAKGNLDYTLKLASNHEFTQISTAFNKMIKDLKESQDEVLKSREILTQVTEGIEEGLMVLDTDFKIIWANKMILQQSGLKMGEVADKYCYKVTHLRDEPCDGLEDICPVKEAIKTGKPATVLHTHFDKKGNKFFVEVSVYPIKDDKGQIIQFIHVSRDITQRIELENRLKENLQTLEASHEELEKKIEELEKITKLAVDRELKMMELKKRIKELEEGKNV